MDDLQKLTLLIPTFNRYKFLKRALSYYLDSDLQNIIVLDSSDYELKDSELSELLESPKIKYRRFPSDLVFTDKLILGVEQVETKYMVLCAPILAVRL